MSKGRVGVAIGKGAEGNRGSQDMRCAQTGVFMGDALVRLERYVEAPSGSPSGTPTAIEKHIGNTVQPYQSDKVPLWYWELRAREESPETKKQP